MTIKKNADMHENINLKSRFFWGFDETKIKLFLNNFGEENIKLGYILLDLLIYYSENHCSVLAKAAIMEIKRKIWLNAFESGFCGNNSCEITEYIKETLNNSYVFPVSNTDETGVSSEVIAGIFRRYSDDFVDTKNYKSLGSLTDILSLYPKCIIFVDDIIGTGQQFKTFLNDKHHFSLKKSIYEYIKINKDIKFYYLVYGACSNGLAKLVKEFPELEIVCLELFDETDKITNKANEYWEINMNYEEFQKMLKQIEKSFPRNCAFSRDMPVLYGIGRAQNTSFEYYWNKYDGKFNPIMER